MFTKVVHLAQELINIPSVSPNDLGCQEILIQRLQSCGFYIERMNFKDTKNFWAWRGTGKNITFLGHTDVVPAGNIHDWNTPPFLSTIKDNVLFGRGAVDMKGAISAMIIAVESFIKKKPNHKGRISFLITSDEESSGLNGTKKIVSILKKRNESIHYCLVGEPTSEKILGDCIKNGRRGSLSGNLIIYGKQGHVAYPNKSINPIHSSAQFLLDLSSLTFDNGNVFFEPASVQISKIFSEKNCTSNMIPGQLKIFFNVRFGSAVTKQKIINVIQQLLNKYSLNFSIDWQYHAKSFFSSPGLFSKILSNVIYTHTNNVPAIKTNGGTSDGRFMHNLANEIVEFGLLNSTIHQVNECVHVLDLLKLQNIYYDVLENILV